MMDLLTRLYAVGLLVLLVAFQTSCKPVPPALTSAKAGSTAASAAQELDPEQLRLRIDKVLDWTLQNRKLNIQEHAAWQILHGSLAYGKVFPVEHQGEMIPVVDYLSQGGKMNGWTIERGNRLQSAEGEEGETPNYGMRAVVEPGSRTGQGHYDQWLAILSQCDLPPSTTFQVGPDTFTMAQFVQQVQLDTSRNTLNEFSWTLIGLTAYFPTDHTWTDSSGKTWTIADLVQIEVDQGLGEAACGGSHRLIGLTMALNRHKQQGRPVEGPWAAAEALIQERGVGNARKFQNPNGAFSANYFNRPGSSPDLAENLGTTGHTLEFLTLTLEEEQLREPWMLHAADYLCDLFERTEAVSLECGALYHAAHGLILYREKAFGPRAYSTTPEQVTQSE